MEREILIPLREALAWMERVADLTEMVAGLRSSDEFAFPDAGPEQN